MGNIPEFYTGAPVDPVDLRFRGAFLAELWQTLRTGHLVLTAPRRMGKTSVMDYLRDHPENGFSVVSINVQDLTHPADFFQVLLDGFHDAHPDFVRDRLAAGWGLVSGVLGKVDEIDVGGFKLALRGSDPDWRTNWRQHGDMFLAQARNTRVPILFIIDEFPDMLLNLSRENLALLREFLAWFRTQRLNPAPARDSIRWLVGGSVNLACTLDALGLVDLINDLEDISLPPLTDFDIETFVTEMLRGRDVPFDDDVAQRLITRLGRPIPLFMQMATHGSLPAMETRATKNRRHGGRYRLRRHDCRFRRPHSIATLPFEDQEVLCGSETLDCLCIAGTNQCERIGVEAHNAVARNGTPAGRSWRHTPGA